MERRGKEHSHCGLIGLVAEWNRDYDGGYCRDGECMEKLDVIVPGLIALKNPNTFVVPRKSGFS